MLVLLALLPIAQLIPAYEAHSRGNLGEELYWASVEASGSRLCNRNLSVRYRRGFERRYGDRIRALVSYHVEWFGADPNFVVTSSCRKSKASAEKQDLEHSKALDRFDIALRNIERRYGP